MCVRRNGVALCCCSADGAGIRGAGEPLAGGRGQQRRAVLRGAGGHQGAPDRHVLVQGRIDPAAGQHRHRYVNTRWGEYPIMCGRLMFGGPLEGRAYYYCTGRALLRSRSGYNGLFGARVRVSFV